MITPEKCIPNCVGRLDPVMDAIRAHDWDLADKLLMKEHERMLDKMNLMRNELRKQEESIHELLGFYVKSYSEIDREKIHEEASR